MRKIMMTLAAVLCCAMTMTVFTACGDDDDIYVEGITTKAEKAWGQTINFTGSASIHTSTTGEKLPAYTEAWERRGGVLNKTYTFDKDGNQVSSGSIE